MGVCAVKHVTPSWLYDGGYTQVMECQSCGRTSDEIDFTCEFCGGRVEFAGAAKWIQPRNPEWRWWRFWWPRYLPGKWVRADRGQEVVV